MSTSARRRVAGVLFLHGAFIWTASAITCYSPGGYILVSFNYQPCYANGTGPCCSSGDECLSNGMCFNAGANNLVLQSGCTDPTFTEPGCAIICTDGAAGYDFYACPETGSSGKPVDYCCGDNCCTAGVSTFTAPVGTVIRGQIPGSTSSSPSLSSSLTLSSLTSSSSSTSGSTSSTPLGIIGSASTASTGASEISPTQTPPSASPLKDSNSRIIAIGLGVGIPLGLILIGALMLVFGELRRHNKLLEAKKEPEREHVSGTLPQERGNHEATYASNPTSELPYSPKRVTELPHTRM